MKEQWGKITDDELDRAEGLAEQMVGAAATAAPLPVPRRGHAVDPGLVC